jgi:DNA-binding transcriptional MerR regulator
MSEYKTLQEIYNTLGITRRAIQGYEEIGLVRASDKNKYGYLLYGESELKRIEKIKMYQEFGFKLKEIKEIIDVPILS